MRNAKRSWRFIIVAEQPDQYNPYAGIAFTIYGTSARKALAGKIESLPEGRFYGVVYEPRTRRVISTALLDCPFAVNSTPHNDDFFIPINVTLQEMEEHVRKEFGEWS